MFGSRYVPRLIFAMAVQEMTFQDFGGHCLLCAIQMPLEQFKNDANVSVDWENTEAFAAAEAYYEELLAAGAVCFQYHCISFSMFLKEFIYSFKRVFCFKHLFSNTRDVRFQVSN